MLEAFKNCKTERWWAAFGMSLSIIIGFIIGKETINNFIFHIVLLLVIWVFITSMFFFVSRTSKIIEKVIK